MVAREDLLSAREWGETLVVVGTWSGTLVAALWLLVAGLLLVGFFVGPAPAEPGTGPTVDTSEPPAEVAADAVAQLRHRDHAVQHWLVRVARTGDVSGGIVYRARVDHDDRTVRVSTYPGVFGDGFTRPSDPHFEFYGTADLGWQRGAPGGHWRRIPNRGFRYEETVSGVPGYESTFRNAHAEVVAENASRLVVRITDGDAMDAVMASPNATRRRLVVVVDKQPEPHLERIAYGAEGPTYRHRSTYYVGNLDTTEAPRPDGVAPPRATGGLIRAVRGAGRIVGWLPP